MEKVYHITAVITTYKRDWVVVERAIKSILNQTYPVEEILLVDDNPPGNEYSRINRRRAAEYQLIRYIPMEKNSGVAAARNRGIAEANTEWISFCDDDDEWLPFKLECQIEVLEKHPGAALAFGMGEYVFDPTGERTKIWQWDHFVSKPTYRDILRFDYVGSIHALVKVEAMRRVGGYITENLPAVEDYEMWIRIVKHNPVVGVHKVLAIFHMDDKQHVSTNLKNTFLSYQSIYHMYRKDYQRFPEAHLQILWNISRDGIKSRNFHAIPYIFKWFFLWLNPASRKLTNEEACPTNEIT